MKFTRSDELRDASFVGVDLRGARFAESDLSGVVMRGVELAGADLDAPWLPFAGSLLVNGVDVIPYVEAELDRRFPGRSLRRALDPDGLRAAWAALEQTWAATLDRAASLPVDESVAGEWSFAQTLRHLVMATDMWFGRGILEREQPFHPLALVDAGTAATFDSSVLRTDTPTYAEVLEARADRADRVAMVRDFLAAVTAEQLDEPRKNPHEPAQPETVRSCLHVILEEEWEHHRFAVRDLDALSG